MGAQPTSLTPTRVPGLNRMRRMRNFCPSSAFGYGSTRKTKNGSSWIFNASRRFQWGFFLASIHKGSNIQIEQTAVNNEVWLPKHVALRLDARVLFSGENVQTDVTYRD